MNQTKKCPQCGKEIPQNSASPPFCSERCKLLDLGAWASGKYALASSEAPEEQLKEEE